ncbi:CocE/NonD family hydrolase [Pontibacillus yanchengensis]|uniref:CocE/NonD family hydrolase n=1 Tax=Pontibacillus yanchengensis TaxID=462910 RepID=A0A6I5A1K4_9BACI|nr:CocE/NonD family hydrolase [Pontibacillus yanchengensis]MYL34323.1 CocE/NonD family hydrolase [Pontibacillus yanchengensis]
MKGRKQVIVEQDIPCTLRDGTTLYANIYRPEKFGTFPVLLTRLPYNKNLPDFSHRYIDPLRLARAGYVVIIQDVRGRFTSEGVFKPFIQEREDGYDAVEWAASLPYSNGEVGMFGLSYYGFTQIYAAAEQPPSLKAMAPAMTGNDLQDGLVYRGGAFELGLFATWMIDSVAPDMLMRNGKDDKQDKLPDIYDYLDHINEWLTYTPLRKWPPLRNLPEVRDVFLRFAKPALTDDIFTQTSYKKELATINIPAFHIAGWYDCFLGTTIENYTEMSKSDADQKLIIGPWGHGEFDSLQGEVTFGSSGSGSWIDRKGDIMDLHIEWFNKWMNPAKESGKTFDSTVSIFIMGINQWRYENEWPLARTQFTPFYFHGDGSGSTGRLSTQPPGVQEETDTYIYNPNNPVPTVGGGTLFYQGLNAGAHDQREVEQRGDVLTYTTPILEKSLEVTGPIKVVLWASTDVKDTDFTAKLVDVYPDGTAINLTDGIIRARYREGPIELPDLQGERVRYEVDLWATSNVYLPGHAIRVEISSSNFPRYDVNLNTGLSGIDSTDREQATQTIYHDQDYPSHIVLPIIPG